MTEFETEYIAFIDAHLPHRGISAATQKLFEEMNELHDALHRKGSDEIEAEMADVALCLLNLLVLFRRLNLPCSGSLDAAMRAKLRELQSRAAQGVWPKASDPGRLPGDGTMFEHFFHPLRKPNP